MIAGIYTVSSAEGEKFYICMFLVNGSGFTSLSNLKTLVRRVLRDYMKYAVC